MPEISRFFGIIIRMYFGDHNPPHFHAIYQEASAEYDIVTLKVIGGNLPARAHALVLEWASMHREELLEDWRLASEMKEVKKIAPLT
jgi:hypothetical protein